MLLVKLYDGDREIFIDMHNKSKLNKPFLIRCIEFFLRRIKWMYG